MTSRWAGRSPPAGRCSTSVINTASGDTYWSQYTNDPTGAAGSVVAAHDTAPTNDKWNMVAVELVNDDN